MAVSSWSPILSPILVSPSFSAHRNPNSHFSIPRTRPLVVVASSSEDDISYRKPTKLVTFLGKGGSGKTTTAVFAAQVVGEELGVLPGMDPIFSVYMLEKLVGLFGIVGKRNHQKDKFDIIVYDGISSEETLRIIGAPSRARLYLKYWRSVAEKTDIGRLAGPSLLRLVREALNLSSGGSHINGKMSAEIWDTVERALERGSSAFLVPQKFGCYLVMDANNPASVSSALRHWGCAIQAGAHVSGAFCVTPSHSSVELARIVEDLSPLPFALLPYLSSSYPLDWNSIVTNVLSKDARDLLSVPGSQSSSHMPYIQFDRVKKSVTLLLPGFDKSDIKLYQYRGGSELLVEAGDQRRVIRLPLEVQGKVGGAKFIDRSLVITMR
ncbi:uncharacterized protein At1g26090, chloroplastic isoform X2 [Malania oleifera]|uniref:uncharacterized protein At1g26090, chloroplastic isoform X2 n=1 Tax=Malania oleifera TaxID=397392 RepID=UPI0025AE7438|nr:uncharacterized protein At1g26090, chloroplastic isoform X2 [Malania oleifera]